MTQRPSTVWHWGTKLRWCAGQSLVWQILGLLLVWVYISALHWHNDGLWPQGDAARHAANGLFWRDFLAAFPVNPVKFALSYYARYPVIHPTAYPPVFYLVESVAYALFGESPFVAKHVVLLFTLVASFYVTAWLRRWIAPEAGWGGVLLILQPGVIQWSHAIMLNIPAMALCLAALYHTRRWLEDPPSRHVYLSASLALLTTLTYMPAGVVMLIILAWIIAERRWTVFQDRRVWLLIGLSALGLLPWFYVMLEWAPMHVSTIVPGLQGVAHLNRWLQYYYWLPTLCSGWLLGTAVLGILTGLWHRQQRREVQFLLLWGVVGYLALSYVWFRAPRYALVLAPGAVILGTAGVFWCLRWATTRWGLYRPGVFLAGLAALVVPHVVTAPAVKVPLVTGFQKVVAFLEQEVPRGHIFYDGRHDGIFSFYIRIGSPRFERGVVLGDKLLYASAIYRRWRLTEKVQSPEEVVEAFRKRCGCQWLVIGRSSRPYQVDAIQHLYKALEGPEFEFVRSFPIVNYVPMHVDVYRFIPSTSAPQEFDLPFPHLGEGKAFQARPIER